MVAAISKLPVLTETTFGISGSTMGSAIEIVSKQLTNALSSISSLGDFIFKYRGEAEGLAEGREVGMACEAGL